MKKLKFFIVLSLILGILSACGSQTLVGRWEIGLKNAASGDSFTETLEFFDDGTYDFGGYGSGTYSVSGDRIKLDKKYGYPKTYTFKIDGDNLNLNCEGSNMTLHKVK